MKNARHCSMNPLTLLMVAGTFAAMSAAASAQTIQRESTGGSGEQGDGSSTQAVLSPDASRILFRTAVTNWADGSSGQGGTRVILKNRFTGAIQLLNGYGTASPPLSGSTLNQGTPSQLAFAGGTKYAWVVSNDFGISFEPCPDTNGFADIFNSGNPTPCWTRLTTPNPCGTQSNGSSGNPSFHRNADALIFDSVSTTFTSGDTATRDVFSVTTTGARSYSKKSVTGSILTGITTGNGDSSNGSAGSGASENVTAFESAAINLVASDTNNVTDIFARVEPTGFGFPFTERLSVSTAGVQGNAASTNAAISADGRYVAFESFASNLVSGDNNGQKDIFLRDRQTDTTRRLSIAMNGVEANGASINPVISDDGNWVAFVSNATNLIPSVTAPAVNNVYLAHVPSGAIFAVSYNYVTNTFATGGASNPSLALSFGEIVVSFDTSASNLGGTDTNNAPDVNSYSRGAGISFDECGDNVSAIADSAGSIFFNTSGAIPTTGGVIGACGSSAYSPDVYFRFIPPCTGTYTFDTVGSNFDTVLTVLSSCGGTIITCNDDTSGLTSQVSFAANANQSYIIRVSGFANRSGSGPLNWSNSIAAPANDDFCSATPVGEGAFPFSNCGATTDGPVASCVGDNGFGKDVWFRYTPTVSGIVEISNCGSNFDTMLGVYSGTCPSGFGTLITCNDDACGLSSRVSFSAIAGQPVSIRVAGLGLSRGGSGTLVIRPRQCSPADITNTDGDNPGFPDSAVDNGDFSAFFSAFFLPASDPLRLMADIANTDGDTYLQGAGADGVVDNGDFSAFFTYFFLGCPLP
ncbi:MAG: TolB family protein [Phycisphaerales bacterium]|jgi:hypothetical protein|nr:hypothetical protein [Phycisphaeraceae bacterium]